MSALKKKGTVVFLPRRKGLPGKQELKRFVSGTDLIFHFGGVNRGTDEEILNGNIIATSRLLESISNDGKPSARLIFSSSSQIYSLVNCKKPISESKKSNPDTVYGVSKQNAENPIRISGVPFAILRLANVYGPGCRPNYNSVVATLCHRAVQGLPLMINGDGKQGRDFVFVDDVVRAFTLAGLGALSGSGKVFNVSSGRVVSLKQIVQQICQRYKKTKVTYIKDNKNSEISYCCDSSRFSKKYDWRPQVSLSKGIEQTLSYHRRNKKR